jgi:hypothetical protein
MMQQDRIAEYRDELTVIYKLALDYFQPLSTKHRDLEIENSLYLTAFEGLDYWHSLSDDEQQVADRLARRLTKVMGKIAIVAKGSPLFTDADAHDLTINTKKMRAALYLREYQYWGAQVISNEDTVFGIQRGSQSEEQQLDFVSALKSFQYSYSKALKIIDLIESGEGEIVSPIGQSLQHLVAKYRPNTAFIMMWMDPSHAELEDVSNAIKDVCSSFNIQAVRADDVEHQDKITDVILQQIAESEFLIADLSGERPNVYYEVGYAHAMNKRPILFRNHGTKLHFDLSVHNVPEYKNATELKKLLTKRFEAILGRGPG